MRETVMFERLVLRITTFITLVLLIIIYLAPTFCHSRVVHHNVDLIPLPFAVPSGQRDTQSVGVEEVVHATLDTEIGVVHRTAARSAYRSALHQFYILAEQSDLVETANRLQVTNQTFSDAAERKLDDAHADVLDGKIRKIVVVLVFRRVVSDRRDHLHVDFDATLSEVEYPTFGRRLVQPPGVKDVLLADASYSIIVVRIRVDRARDQQQRHEHTFFSRTFAQ